MPVIIKIENLSKQYRLGLVSTSTISHDLNRWWAINMQGKEDPYLKIGEINERSSKGGSDYVWALKDINLEISQGEVMGIIGKNGAGKSTLLKILSKVTAPTTGTIKANGRIASLLEVGTGFHQEMTGRENIFLNGAIMGMTKAEILQKFDEIVDFSGVERYIDTPVKRYSSGMIVRLGFAVAAHLEPEILVVDEVLAVGDAEFQKKAISKMQDVSRGDGRTILFVSHNLTAVENLCNKLIILQNGKMNFSGNVVNGIKMYLKSFTKHKIYKTKSTDNLYKDKYITLFNINIIQNGLTDNFSTKEPIEIDFHYEVNEKIIGLRVGFDLIDSESEIVIFRSFHDEDTDELIYTYPGNYRSKAVIPAFLLKDGIYKINIRIGIHCVKWLIYDLIDYEFTVYNIGGINRIYADRRPGLIMPKIHWENILYPNGHFE